MRRTAERERERDEATKSRKSSTSLRSKKVLWESGLRKQQKEIRFLKLGLLASVIIATGAIIFSFLRPVGADPAPGTCLPISKGGTGCFDIEFLDKLYPIGAIYISTVNTNPNSFLGGTWASFGSGQTLVGVDTGQTEFNTVEKAGGAKTGSFGLDGGASYAKMALTQTATNNLTMARISTPSYTSQFAVTLSPYPLGSAGLTSGAGAELGGETNPGSLLQPYITVYFYKRTN